MKAWENLPSSLRRENTENAVANATRVHPWDVKIKTGSRVQTIPRDIPSSTDVPVLLLNHSIVPYLLPSCVNVRCQWKINRTPFFSFVKAAQRLLSLRFGICSRCFFQKKISKMTFFFVRMVLRKNVPKLWLWL